MRPSRGLHRSTLPDPPTANATEPVERAFNRLTQFPCRRRQVRQVEDRYHATVTKASIKTWLRAKRDRARS
jgi:hypothetical protein